MKKFEDVISAIEEIVIENTINKTTEQVAEEIREKIRELGWSVLDEYEDEQDWCKDNATELLDEDCEWSCVSEYDYLCDNDGFLERMNGHDVDWYTFSVTFYGVWASVGVFKVEII